MLINFKYVDHIQSVQRGYFEKVVFVNIRSSKQSKEEMQ